jgi:integral membrane sensor domain MASE1
VLAKGELTKIVFVTASGEVVPLVVDKVLLAHLMPPETYFLNEDEIRPFVSALLTKLTGLNTPALSALQDIQVDFVTGSVFLACQIIALKNSERARLYGNRPGGANGPTRM